KSPLIRRKSDSVPWNGYNVAMRARTRVIRGGGSVCDYFHKLQGESLPPDIPASRNQINHHAPIRLKTSDLRGPQAPCHRPAAPGGNTPCPAFSSRHTSPEHRVVRITSHQQLRRCSGNLLASLPPRRQTSRACPHPCPRHRKLNASPSV